MTYCHESCLVQHLIYSVSEVYINVMNVTLLKDVVSGGDCGYGIIEIAVQI